MSSKSSPYRKERSFYDTHCKYQSDSKEKIGTVFFKETGEQETQAVMFSFSPHFFPP
jgi:hypothetical protein